ncbi:hypothetical protein Tco_0881448 [Tanacetum coccineum]
MVAFLDKPEGSEDFHEIVDFFNSSHIRFIQIFLTKQQRLLQPDKKDYTAPALTPKLFSNMKRVSKGYTGVDIPLFPTMLVQGPVEQGEGSTIPVESHHTPTSAPSSSHPLISQTYRRRIRQEDVVPQPSSPTHIHVADETTSTRVDVKTGGATTTVSSLDVGQGSGTIAKSPSMPHDSPLPRVNTLGSDKGSMSLQELMVLYTNLSKKVETLEDDLKRTKETYSTALTKVIKKVKRLEETLKSSKTRKKFKVVLSDDDEDLKDPSKQGRKIAQIEEDPDITLVHGDAELQGRSQDISTGGIPVSFACAGVSTTGTEETLDDLTMADALVQIRKSAKKAKDKGKAIMEESDSPVTKTKRQLKKFLKLQGEEYNLLYLWDLILEEGINVEALQTKYLIIDWEVYTKDSRKYWKIIRVGGHTEVELKRLFELDPNDELWKTQENIHQSNMTSWRLYDTCGVYHVSTTEGIDIYMLVEKEYPLSKGVLILMLVAKLMVDQHSEMASELLRRIYI